MKNVFLIVGLITIVVIGVTISIGKKPKTNPVTIESNSDNTPAGIVFTGEKGETIKLENGQLNIDPSSFETNKVEFFNTILADGKTIYFLVLKDKDGNFRAAANANKQCAAYGKGYRQVGDEIECLTCNKKYPLTDFAVAQPDCNPFPINAKLPTKDGQIVINSTELESVASLF